MRALRLLSLIVVSLPYPLPAQPRRPDIVIVMADDMGWSDIGCYGGEVRTPALDALAAGGLRFTQFYNAGRCCPTRASLLTGLHPHQAGVGHMMSDRGHDGYRGDLNRRCRTIAEVLRPAGYGTYMSGKWHVSRHRGPAGPKDNWPRQRGFDRFYGTIHGAGSFYDPCSLTRENTQIAPDRDPYYYTDAISDEAVRYVREHHASRRSDPLFLYVAYTAPHWPMHAKPEDVIHYDGVYDAGWDAVRAARLERQREMKLLDPRWALSDRDRGVPPFADVQDKEWFVRRMEVYAAMITSLDAGVGRIVSALHDTGRLEDTLFLFLADNGGCAEEFGSTGKVRPDPGTPVALRPMAKRALQPDMVPKVTREGRPVRAGYGVMPGPPDTYVAYGKPWANASNTPFRMYKHWVHEGGIATPLIAHWPRTISRAGELEHQPGHLIDLMATCVDVGRATYPTEVDGHAIRPLEGVSLAPAFAGRPLPERALFWEHEGNRAVRVGRWKLVARGARGPWELYDLAADRTETNDLAASQPARVAALAARWQDWAERAAVLPLNPAPPERRDRFSRRTRFELGPGADLPRARAPYVTGRGFTVEVEIARAARDGVLVAQGGGSDGWALWLDGGRPVFGTRVRGHLTVVASEAPLPADARRVRATLSRKGAIVIRAGDLVLARGEAPGALARMPVDGLQVGLDARGAVGTYRGPHRFRGEIAKVVVTLGPPK